MPSRTRTTSRPRNTRRSKPRSSPASPPRSRVGSFQRGPVATPPRVEAKMSYQWDWQVYLQDTGAGQTLLQWMMSAWGWAIAVAVLGWVVALVFGSLIGVLRTVPSTPLRWLGNAWVELFRNIPLLVQIFLWYHVIPAMIPSMKSLLSFI